MNFRQFEALYWIRRLGSFHAAARQLRTSQPAISARVRELELELGVVVFDRSDRRMRPTPKGLELLQYAERIVGIAQEIRERVGAPESLVGRVRLGVTPISAIGWVPAMLEHAAQSAPGIAVELVVDTSDVMRMQLERAELDLAVVLGVLDSSRLRHESLGSLAVGWIASPRLRLPEGCLSAADLAAVPVITDRAGTHLFSAAMTWFREDGAAPAVHHACSSLPTRVQMAGAGLGAALVALSAAADEIAARKVRVVRTRRPVAPLPCGLAWSEAGMSPQARVVADMVRLAVAEHGGIDIAPAAPEAAPS
ncbi:MAG: LysR family transcriptional regulator [Acidisphaera sp.]|nr:LysR family transcriptional regulator [Acidisphaera sp.]